MKDRLELLTQEQTKLTGHLPPRQGLKKRRVTTSSAFAWWEGARDDVQYEVTKSGEQMRLRQSKYRDDLRDSLSLCFQRVQDQLMDGGELHHLATSGFRLLSAAAHRRYAVGQRLSVYLDAGDESGSWQDVTVVQPPQAARLEHVAHHESRAPFASARQ